MQVEIDANTQSVESWALISAFAAAHAFISKLGHDVPAMALGSLS
jgi:hypothetical protein